ncbi:MAG: hypothetical protein ACOC6R_01335 [Chloroflexota bacterium]
MVEEVTEANLVRRILEGVSGGYYPNAYFLYQKLPKAFRERYSYWDVLKLFHELEWNAKVIEIERVYETSAWNPWRLGGPVMQKKVIEFRIRQGFEGWNIAPGLFEKILDSLHQEYPKMDFEFPSPK